MAEPVDRQGNGGRDPTGGPEDPTGLTAPAEGTSLDEDGGESGAGPSSHGGSDDAAAAAGDIPEDPTSLTTPSPAGSFDEESGAPPDAGGSTWNSEEPAPSTPSASNPDGGGLVPAEIHVEQPGSDIKAMSAPPGEATGPVDDAMFHVEPELAALAPSDAPGRPVRALPRVVAVANQKGGVGKTTTAVNLGAALAELGYRTLIVDLDPQGNATTGLGINARGLETSIYDVLMREVPIEDALEPTSVRNLFVVPATIDLAGAEIELVPAFSRELRLKRALEGVADDFDFTLVDCPPSLGLLTVNALAAANEVVVPVQCEYYALEGLSALLRNVQLVQSNLNTTLEVSTIILTMFDARTKLAGQVAQEVRNHFGQVVCRHIVPRTVRLSEAPSFGQPIIVFDPTSRGAIAYRELAKEVSGGTPQRVG